jgi:hypothetical protein
MIRQVNNKENLEEIENEVIHNLESTDLIKMVISGFNRSKRKSSNIIKIINKDGRFLVVVNILDGNANYFRGSEIYGISISVLDYETCEEFSLIFDGLRRKIFEINNGTIKGLNILDSNSKSRPVIGLGTYFHLNDAAFFEISHASLRSIGSTTVSIMEVLENHFDLYINKTKLWNVWWALGLSKKTSLSLLNLENGRPISENFLDYLKFPEQSFYLVCYKDESVLEKYANLLQSVIIGSG